VAKLWSESVGKLCSLSTGKAVIFSQDCCAQDCPTNCEACPDLTAESANSGCANCEETGMDGVKSGCGWSGESGPGGVTWSITCLDVGGVDYWRFYMQCPTASSPTNTFTQDFIVRTDCPPTGIYVLDSGGGGGDCLGYADLIITLT